MSGNYIDFSPKAMTVGGQIASGSVELRHLSAELFSEIQSVKLHSHTGTRSRRVNLQDLIGYFKTEGFIMYSSDGTKKYQVTIDSSTDDFVLTDIT
jgi:hypothetical protein